MNFIVRAYNFTRVFTKKTAVAVITKVPSINGNKFMADGLYMPVP